MEELLAAGARLVTLTGPGGAGKTRLALEVAARLEPVLAGQLWFVPLETATDAEGVLALVAVATAAHSPTPEDVADALGTSPALLVLDNHEQALSAAPTLRALMELAPSVAVLVTSRAALRIAGEVEVPLGPLPEAAAVGLLEERAAAVRPGWRLPEEQREDAKVLCARLDGLPLAIELAAARLKLMPPADLVHRLDAGTDALRGGPDLPHRQRTLQGALEWSLGLLGPHERAVFTQLAVFAGGFGLDLAEQVVDAGDLTVVDALATLVDNSLVTVDPVTVRFSLLQTVHQHARRLLEADALAPRVRAAHRDAVLGLARTLAARLDGEAGPAALTRLREEAANLGAALDDATRHDPAAAADTLVALRPYWVLTGRIREGLRRLRDLPSSARTPAVDVCIAALTYQLTDFDAAARLLPEAADAAAAAGDARHAGLGWALAAAVAAIGGDPEGARERVARARAAAPDEYEVGVVTLSALAVVHAVAGDLDGEESLYRQRLGLVQAHGDLARQADTLGNLAEIALEAGRPGPARAHAEQALAIAERVGPIETRDAALALARACLAAGAVAEAADHAARALPLSVELGQSLGLAQALRAGAAVATAAGDPATGARLTAAADAVHRLPGDPPPDTGLAAGARPDATGTEDALPLRTDQAVALATAVLTRAARA
ncbi:MAG: hypothetical protein U0Q15_09710 [Kineosporiaceae bacterium]